jgi:hypothetical protein
MTATRPRLRRRPPPCGVLAPVVACIIVLGACGSSPKASSAHHGRPAPAGSSTTTAPGAAGAGPASAPGTPAVSSAPSRPTTTTAVPSKGPSMSSPTPPEPGTYTYSQQGGVSALGSTQSFPPQGTEVIDAPSAQGAGSWTQVWHSYLSSSQPPDDTTVAIAPSGISIVSEVVRMAAGGQTITFTCTFSAPIEVIDWPPTVGHQFAGSGSCSSPNNSYGSFTVNVHGTVSGTQATSIGGAPTTAYVISTDATTSGAVVSSSSETDWFDPASRLDLYVKSQESGTYDGVQFSSQDTRTLVSTSPS